MQVDKIDTAASDSKGGNYVRGWPGDFSPEIKAPSQTLYPFFFPVFFPDAYKRRSPGPRDVDTESGHQDRGSQRQCHQDPGWPRQRVTKTEGQGHQGRGSPGHKDRVTRKEGHQDRESPGNRVIRTEGHPETRSPGRGLLGQIQTVIKPRFYPRLCQFLMTIIPVINWVCACVKTSVSNEGLGMCQPNDFDLIWEFLRFGLTQRSIIPGNFGFAITISVCRLRERGRMSMSGYVRVVHDLELLRYVLRCAIERQV